MSVNNTLQRLARVAAAPVVMATPLFVLVLVMDSLVNCRYIIATPELGINPVNAIIQLARAFVLAWMAGGVWILLRRLGRVAAALWSAIVVALLLVSALFDVVIYEVYHTTFTVEHTAILLATNPGEASDFVDTYFSARLLGVMASMVAVFALAWMAGVWLGRNLRVTPLNLTDVCSI